MKRYAVSSGEVLILRDGRPFGEVGTFGGTSLPWPLPQTLAGMCRTAVGFGRSDNYFTQKENCEAVLSIGLKKIMACLAADGKREPLLPTPADLVFTDEPGPMVHSLVYLEGKDGEGTDLSTPFWLYATATFQGKPSLGPMFLRPGLASDYIQGEIPPGGIKVDHVKQTVGGPVREFRIHSAIDARTRSVDEGRLYAESGIYLTAAPVAESTDRQGKRTRHPGDLEIGFELNGLGAGEKPPASMYLGGERRRVNIARVAEETFLQPVKSLGNQRLLKLVLTTHGDFGAWVPRWLLPNGNIPDLDWVKEPATGIEIRLRSAVVKGWDPLSGWDYAARKPKAFRKLVRPGAVYLIELKDPAQSETLAHALWGTSLCPHGSQAERDGFGQVIVAKTHVLPSGKESS